MKKRIILHIAFAIALLLTLIGCIKYSDPNELQIGEEIEVPIMEVEHNGHNYLLFEGYGVIHDPNCSCQRVSEE